MDGNTDVTVTVQTDVEEIAVTVTRPPTTGLVRVNVAVDDPALCVVQSAVVAEKVGNPRPSSARILSCVVWKV